MPLPPPLPSLLPRFPDFRRLKVYEALYLVSARDIKGAAALLLQCVATFTCTELCSYQEFIFYAVRHT